MKDLFEGDVIIQHESFNAQFARRAFGPLGGPILLTNYGVRMISGSANNYCRASIAEDNDVTGPIFDRGTKLMTTNLGFVYDGAGPGVFPAIRSGGPFFGVGSKGFEVNRVVNLSQFYILMEIEQVGVPSVREVMQVLELRYLNRPIIEILNVLKIA